MTCVDDADGGDGGGTARVVVLTVLPFSFHVKLRDRTVQKRSTTV